jgi:hypothetical protein
MYKDKKIAFIIPIHSPHFPFLIFLKDLNETNLFTIFFILTLEEDIYSIKEYINLNILTNFKNIQYISLESITGLKIKKILYNYKGHELRDKGIINIKKLCALNYIYKNFNNFDYLACIDSEIKFINSNNIYEKFYIFCNNKKIIGGNTSNSSETYKNIVSRINNDILLFFSQNDNNIIINATKNLNLYFWFSDIPIYDVEILPRFFNYINFDNEDIIDKINFWTFDYILYIYYCLIYENYKLIDVFDYDIKSRNWSMEYCDFDMYDNVFKKINYMSNWCIGECYYKYKDLFNQNNYNIILLYHENYNRMVVI